MSSATLSIRSLPTRYEPLTNVFGQKAKATFIESASDIEFAKRLISSAESAQQGKIAFISAASGSGKSTFVHGLEIFLADKVDHVERIPEQHELPVEQIPGYIAKIPRKGKLPSLTSTVENHRTSTKHNTKRSWDRSMGFYGNAPIW